jgi:hypothetical protein
VYLAQCKTPPSKTFPSGAAGLLPETDTLRYSGTFPAFSDFGVPFSEIISVFLQVVTIHFRREAIPLESGRELNFQSSLDVWPAVSVSKQAILYFSCIGATHEGLDKAKPPGFDKTSFFLRL